MRLWHRISSRCQGRLLLMAILAVPPLGTLLVMLPCQDQVPLKDVVGDPLRDAAGAAHQSGLPLAPLRVPCLGAARLAAALVAPPVLPRRKRGKEASIGAPVIRAHRLVPVIGR